MARDRRVLSTSSLTIVGSSPAVPRPGKANSCYLIQTSRSHIVLDLGSGALSKLMTIVDLESLDAVIITHLHADHFFDLVPLRYALTYKVRRRSRLRVYVPRGAPSKLQRVVSAFSRGRSFFEDCMDVREYTQTRALRIRDTRLRMAKTRHYIDAYAVRAEGPDGTIVFSSDTGPAQRVINLAHRADVFLCESGLGAAGSEPGRRGHCNAAEAGAMAAAAEVSHLVLTHYPSTERPANLRRAASAAFSGTITVADDGMRIPFR